MLETTQVDVPERLTQFIEENERFKSLPQELKTIAINTAQTVLGYKDEDLLIKAGEIDAEAIENEFARVEQEVNGRLVEADRIYRTKLLTKRSFEEAMKIGLSQLRQSMSSRMSKIALAGELGYQPGKYKDIVANPHFAAANDLCWQLVREFQLRS